MAKIAKPPVQLTTSFITGYTVSTDMQATLIEIRLFNGDTVSRTPVVRIVNQGGTPGNEHEIIGSGAASILIAKEDYALKMEQYLEAGDFIELKADAASVVTSWIGVIEIAADLTKYRNLDALFLTASAAIIHTVAANKQATLMDLLLHNRDTVARTVDLYAVPSGGSAGIGNQLRQVSLDPGEFYHPAPINLHRVAATTIEAKADTASVVVMKLSVLEESV